MNNCHRMNVLHSSRVIKVFNVKQFTIKASKATDGVDVGQF